jgi:hypothetical protein
MAEIRLELRSRAERKLAHSRQAIGTDHIFEPAQTCMLQVDAHIIRLFLERDNLITEKSLRSRADTSQPFTQASAWRLNRYHRA